MASYLAVDIGASSGRHILGTFADGRLALREIYRFENGMKEENGALVWDTEALFESVLAGLEECRRQGVFPKSVAIDTWGVDYVLLDGEGKEMPPTVAYRDKSCEGAVRHTEGVLNREYLYARTGIQHQDFNSVFRLSADGRTKSAKRFLMMPDYLTYRLTGKARNEYTNATTTGLVNAKARCWDGEILQKAGIPAEIFLPLSQPGESLGGFKAEIRERLGFDCEVLLCPTHDTASAVAACPIDEGSVYISSGTWSLIGTENAHPVLTERAREANFTNEGGIGGRYRFLKNIMGMWLFQCVKKELPGYSYDGMMHLAMESGFDGLTDPNLPCYTAPKSMLAEVRRALGAPSLPTGDVLRCLYRSLALSYKRAIDEIEEISGKRIENIFIIGGGSRDAYLNALTAQATGRRVYTGLAEATAVGNILSQYMADKGLCLDEARETVKHSFDIKEFDYEQI